MATAFGVRELGAALVVISDAAMIGNEAC